MSIKLSIIIPLTLLLSTIQNVNAAPVQPVSGIATWCAAGSGATPSANCTPCLQTLPSLFYSTGGWGAACLPCQTGSTICNVKTGVVTACASNFTLKGGNCVINIVRPSSNPVKVALDV